MVLLCSIISDFDELVKISCTLLLYGIEMAAKLGQICVI